MIIILPAISYDGLVKKVGKLKKKQVIGIFIGTPKSKVTKSIIQNLPEFNGFTGKDANIFFPGYGAYYPKNEAEVVVRIGNIDWQYSGENFGKFIRDFESHTSWKYNGQPQLLILKIESGQMDYSEVLIFKLSSKNLEIDEDITNLFYKIFRHIMDNNTIGKISMMEITNQIANIVKNYLNKSSKTSMILDIFETTRPIPKNIERVD